MAIPIPPASIPELPSTVSGINYVPSGVAQVSGVIDPTGAFSGPWEVTTQEMEIEYWRVPQPNTPHLQNGTAPAIAGLPPHRSQPFDVFCTLSSVHAGVRVWGTALNLIVKASVSKRIVSGTYATSAFQQPQKFALYAASADKNGMTYPGETNATLPAGCMGPLGTITTVQPYYHRRPITPAEIAATDPSSYGTFSLDGTNINPWTTVADGGFSAVNARDYIGSYDDHSVLPGVMCSNRDHDQVYFYRNCLEVFFKLGTYTYDMERTSYARTVIRLVCERLGGPQPFLPGGNPFPTNPTFITLNLYPMVNDWYGPSPVALAQPQWPGVPPPPSYHGHPPPTHWLLQYDVNRHQYSGPDTGTGLL